LAVPAVLCATGRPCYNNGVVIGYLGTGEVMGADKNSCIYVRAVRG
jgi:hypothetical protein